ncbi:hypothetical protein DFH11DRAFT_1728887 [Phellopilus nigrolimitatus]|nr:hypothetical protein DFH11DRAFT_1728887 [Phellopilus nigrolimitatus]
MKPHSALDPTLLGSLKRHLPGKRRNSLLDLDMSSRVDWLAKTDAFLDEPATSPPHTTLYIELAGLDARCANHGDRQFKIERACAITVRDVLAELDAFLHRRAPELTFVPAARGAGAEGAATGVRRVVRLEHPAESCDSLSSASSSEEDPVFEDGGHGESVFVTGLAGESLMARWLDGRSSFAGVKRADNHDFKLIVHMVKPSAKPQAR